MKKTDLKLTEETELQLAEETLPDLGTNRNDLSAIVVKNVIAGAIPVFLPMFTIMAPFLGDMIANYIPNQRMDRVTKFLKIHSEKFDALEDNLKETIQQTIQDPETVPFVEKVMRMAADSETEQKRVYLASVLNNGLSIDTDTIYRARLLKLVGELDDLDVLRLYGATLDHDFNEKAHNEFWDKYEDTFYYEPDWDAPAGEDVKMAMSVLPTEKLNALKLLDGQYSDAKVTPLGLEVLRFINAEENIQMD